MVHRIGDGRRDADRVDLAEALDAGRNIGAARIVLERAVEMGSAHASFALAETYDPLILSAWGLMERAAIRRRQALFEGEGTTFSQYVLGQRLARVHRLLSAPHSLGRSIDVISLEAGFGDRSHFNRVFRGHYGVTPSEVRAMALWRERSCP